MNRTRIKPMYLNTTTYQNRKSIIASLREVFGQQYSPSDREFHCTFLKSNMCAILGITLLLFLISIAFHIGKCIDYLDDVGGELASMEECRTYLDNVKSSRLLLYLNTCHYEITEQTSFWNKVSVLPATNVSLWNQNFVILIGGVTCDEFENETVDVSKLGASPLDIRTVARNLIRKVSILPLNANNLSLLFSVLGNINDMTSEYNVRTIPVLVVNPADSGINTAVGKTTPSHLREMLLKCDTHLNGNFTVLLDNLLDNVLFITQDVKRNIHRQYVTITILLVTWLTLLICSYYVSLQSVMNTLTPPPTLQRIYSKINLKYMQIIHEKEQSELLLHQMLPASVADKLIAGQQVEAETFEEVTIYFSDIVGFNDVALSASPIQIVNLLNSIYGSVHRVFLFTSTFSRKHLVQLVSVILLCTCLQLRSNIIKEYVYFKYISL